MAATLSGSGGTSCQLCTVSHKQLKDLDLISDGFPIHRFIHIAIDIFNDVIHLRNCIILIESLGSITQ